MITEIFDDETLAAFRSGQPNCVLLDLVDRLVARERTRGFWEAATAIVVADEGDDLTSLLGAVPTDWSWRVEHGSYVELGTTAGNSGFAWIILVPSGSQLTRAG